MSGGGGGGDWRPAPKIPNVQEPSGSAGSGGAGNTNDPCGIVDQTMINSVDRAVLAQVAVGDELALAFVIGPPKQLLAMTDSGNTLGSITSAKMTQIIACIQAGNEYTATVLSITGAICAVRIQRR